MWAEVQASILAGLPPYSGLEWSSSGGDAQKGCWFHYQYHLGLSGGRIRFGVVDNGVMAYGWMPDRRPAQEMEEEWHQLQIAAHAGAIFQLLGSPEVRQRHYLETLQRDYPEQYAAFLAEQEMRQRSNEQMQREMAAAAAREAMRQQFLLYLQQAHGIAQAHQHGPISMMS